MLCYPLDSLKALTYQDVWYVRASALLAVVPPPSVLGYPVAQLWPGTPHVSYLAFGLEVAIPNPCYGTGLRVPAAAELRTRGAPEGNPCILDEGAIDQKSECVRPLGPEFGGSYGTRRLYRAPSKSRAVGWVELLLCAGPERNPCGQAPAKQRPISDLNSKTRAPSPSQWHHPLVLLTDAHVGQTYKSGGISAR